MGTDYRIIHLSYVDPTIARLILDRPPANAFDEKLIERLSLVIEELALDAGVKVLIVGGEGRFFSAGADIRMLNEVGKSATSVGTLVGFARRLQEAFRGLRSLPICTIAAIGGDATGGGLELALSCDIRVIARSARCGLPEIKLGLIPAAGGTQLLTELVGRGTATRLILTGELVGGEEALDLGLAQYVTNDAEVADFSLGLARALARLPRAAISANKGCIALAGTMGGYEAEISGTHQLHLSPETRALVSAFVNRRAEPNAASSTTILVKEYKK